MTSRSDGAPTLFVLLAGLVLVVSGYLAWHMWRAPVDPQEAGDVATRASEVTMRAAGGDAGACSDLRNFTADDEVEAVVARCVEVASTAREHGINISVQDLKATKVDVHRSSGRVTVEGTMLTPGAPMPIHFTWPMKHRDGHWRLAAGPDVSIG